MLVVCCYELIADCKRLLLAGFIFQQYGALAYTVRVTQDWLQANCPGFIEKNQWPPKLSRFEPTRLSRLLICSVLIYVPRIRGFTTMRYINLRFTYLLTYLALTPAEAQDD